MSLRIQQLLDTDTAFCLIQKQDSDQILLLAGLPSQHRRLDDIPRLRGTTENREIFDSISVIPFCQIRERGYGVHDNNEHIRTITIKHQELINTQELRGGLTRLNKFFQFLSGISASVKPPS